MSPCVEILSFDFLIFDWVLFHDLVSVVGVIDPLEQLDRLHSVTGVLVNHRVPNGVQVTDTRVRYNILWHFLSIATHVSGRETVVDLRNGVERLMDVTNVMDDET